MLVSQEGYLLWLDVKNLPYSAEEAMRLGVKDHLEAAFITQGEHSILVVTQGGKLIHRTHESLPPAASLKTRGEPIFSAQRRAQGVRVVSAASVSQEHWGAALHQDGQISLHSVRTIIGAGTIPVTTELVAAAFFAPSAMGNR